MPSASGWQGLPNTVITPLANTGVTTVYAPSQILHAYGFESLPFTGVGQTIAIVDAYDDPNIYSDLLRFDRQFQVPDPPSFVKATPQGMPAPNAAWAGEIALDVEWAHAIAPQANILLVEAASASGADLLAAVDYARYYPGVSVVSMSWGGPEFYNESQFDAHFTTPANHIGGGGLPGGITFVASSGDNGAWSGPEWPSVSPDVLAVGATSLNLTSNGSYSYESGWNGSGGGYSSYVSEPTYQNSVQYTGRRSAPDVAFNGDPSTGVFVFNSYAVPAGYSGWYSFGGTSAAAPQWAALIAQADEGRSWFGRGSMANAQQTIYSLPASDFHTIYGGNNGYSVTAGYNPVTGRGSPLADRVVWSLIWAGNSTLTVGHTAPAAASNGLTNSNSIVAVGTVLGGDGPTPNFVPSFVAHPAVSPAVRTADILFSRPNDGTQHTPSPALTASAVWMPDLSWGFSPVRSYGAPAVVDRDTLDRALFVDGTDEE